MDNQHRVNRRRRRNLPAELKLEIVDCFPVENAAHFLASVPSRLIIHHCAPRVRRMLKKIAADYARTLPASNYYGYIYILNGHKYTPEMDVFLRYGAAHCEGFVIWRGTGDGFVDYPVNFFEDLIKYYYETKVPAKALRHLRIELPLTNPAPWPTALVQPQAGEMKLQKCMVNNCQKWVHYFMRNKHNSGIAFGMFIHFEGGAKCYEQMTEFVMDVRSY